MARSISPGVAAVSAKIVRASRSPRLFSRTAPASFPGLFGLTRVEIKRGKLYTYVGVIGIERRGALKVVEGGPELTGVVERDGEALGGDGIVFIELYDFQKLDDRCLSLALRQIFFPAF